MKITTYNNHRSAPFFRALVVQRLPSLLGRRSRRRHLISRSLSRNYLLALGHRTASLGSFRPAIYSSGDSSGGFFGGIKDKFLDFLAGGWRILKTLRQFRVVVAVQPSRAPSLHPRTREVSMVTKTPLWTTAAPTDE